MLSLEDMKFNLKGAIIAGDTAMVRTLLQEGADVNARDRDGVSVLIHAINFEHPDIVKLLVKNGADILLKCHRKTPLRYAIEQNKTEIVQLLKEYGAMY